MKSNERTPLLSEKCVQTCTSVCEDEPKSENIETQTSEGRSAWLVVAASFLCICVLDGTMYSFGCFLDPLMAEMKQSRGTISSVGSLQVALSAFVAPLAAWLVDKKGARPVCLAGAITATFGLLLASFASKLMGVFGGLSLLTGIGFGLMYIPAVVAVAENFTTRRSLALGLSVSGAGAGQVVVAPLVSWLIQSFGWRGALHALAGLTLSCAGFGMVMKQPATQESDVNVDRNTRRESVLSDYEQQRTILTVMLGHKIGDSEYVCVFLLMVLADALSVMALYIPYSYLQPVAQAAGVPPHLSTFLISAIGVGSVSGRLLSGWMSDQPWCHPLYLTRAVVTISCTLPFLLSWVDHFWMFAGLCFLFGFLTGQWIAATSPLLVSLLGIDQLSKGFGLLTFVRGVASLVSPPLAGMLVDLTINSLMALYLSGMLLLLSGAVYSLAVFVFSRRERREITYQNL
eukprot:GFUD01003731.1.p1 GENE.GFUD01003731.1~~GFUD01003731.1.p1  ORF type:complete len:459 (+),score=139.31 GFUD01003731.1:53-1429(+)